jgi:hypothetical protein
MGRRHTGMTPPLLWVRDDDIGGGQGST